MKWNDGDLVHGFRVSRMSHIEEVNADAYLMEHVKSGARLLSVSYTHLTLPTIA